VLCRATCVSSQPLDAEAASRYAYLHGGDAGRYAPELLGAVGDRERSAGLQHAVGQLYLFRGKRADRVKGLIWDRNGLAIWYKRLERGKFKWPSRDAASIEISEHELTPLDILAPGPVPVNPRCGVFLLGRELDVGGHSLACSHRDRH
jgi:transposase